MSVPGEKVDPAEPDRDRADRADVAHSTPLGASLECFLRNSSDPMLAVDAQGTILFANSGILELFGYSDGDLSGQHVSRLIPEGFSDEGTSRLLALLQQSMHQQQ